MVLINGPGTAMTAYLESGMSCLDYGLSLAGRRPSPP